MIKQIYAVNSDISVVITQNERGIFSVELVRGRKNKNETGPVQALTNMQAWRDYFSGKRTVFNDKIDYSGYTPFQKKVLQIVRRIPYGTTRSYRWVAERAGRPGAARAVGQVMKINRTPVIIPCHRVIRSDGTIGGFSLGTDWKKWLLALEGNV